MLPGLLEVSPADRFVPYSLHKLADAPKHYLFVEASCNSRLQAVVISGHLGKASRSELALTPTCLSRARWNPNGDVAERQVCGPV